MIYIWRKVQKYIVRNTTFLAHKKCFDSMSIILIAVLMNQKVPKTGASYQYLDIRYALMWDNHQFICCYCNFTALKLEANNVNKY